MIEKDKRIHKFARFNSFDPIIKVRIMVNLALQSEGVKQLG